MRIDQGEQVLVRIFCGEKVKWHHQPLSIALVERLRQEGFAGITVLRGIEGFGAHHIVHTAHLLDLADDLPVILEIIESQEAVDRLLLILDEMLGHGLVTLEKVRVLLYQPGEKQP